MADDFNSRGPGSALVVETSGGSGVCVNIDLSRAAHSSAIWSRYMYIINLRKSKWLLAILLCISVKDYLMSNQSRSCSWSKEAIKKC